MFIGHFAVGLGAKSAQPKVSLGSLFLAVQFLDLLWPTLLLLGVEKVEIVSGDTEAIPLRFTSYPVSHSLLMAVVWAVAIAMIYTAVRKDRRGAIVMGLCVLSHWMLDLIVHVPDLPLYPGNAPLLGFSLWKHPWITLIVEMIMFAAGLAMYLRVTKSKNKKGVYGFWGLIIFLVIIHIANIFSPAPPSVNAVAWAGQLQWLIVIWGYWVDRNRFVTPAGATASVGKRMA